ncbi:hypothetical protein ACIBCN_36925 [Nocardia sp. NPDC051052]|uniref:hypothetical protein n=1 Tax=Nocardia sp. NPDC051052 TaxID=3364322 RepID=UPI0037BB3A07
MDTLAKGLGELENLEADGHGGFYVSSMQARKVYDIDSAGNAEVVLDGTKAAGLQLHGTTLDIMDVGNGAVKALDMTTGTVTTVGPLAGNGLLRLPDGDLLTTWVGTEGTPAAGVSRYHRDTGVVQPDWSPVPHGEGLALSPDHTAVFTDDLFTGQVYRIPVDTPQQWTVVGRLPGLLPGDDDLTSTRSGTLYVAGHIAGEIDRLDPTTGATCTVASGISSAYDGPSSVRIGRDGDGWALYVTAFDGTFRRIRPPAGVDLTPVRVN